MRREVIALRGGFRKVCTSEMPQNDLRLPVAFSTPQRIIFTLARGGGRVKKGVRRDIPGWV